MKGRSVVMPVGMDGGGPGRQREMAALTRVCDEQARHPLHGDVREDGAHACALARLEQSRHVLDIRFGTLVPGQQAQDGDRQAQRLVDQVFVAVGGHGRSRPKKPRTNSASRSPTRPHPDVTQARCLDRGDGLAR